MSVKKPRKMGYWHSNGCKADNTEIRFCTCGAGNMNKIWEDCYQEWESYHNQEIAIKNVEIKKLKDSIETIKKMGEV